MEIPLKSVGQVLGTYNDIDLLIGNVSMRVFTRPRPHLDEDSELLARLGRQTCHRLVHSHWSLVPNVFIACVGPHMPIILMSRFGLHFFAPVTRTAEYLSCLSVRIELASTGVVRSALENWKDLISILSSTLDYGRNDFRHKVVGRDVEILAQRLRENLRCHDGVYTIVNTEQTEKR